MAGLGAGLLTVAGVEVDLDLDVDGVDDFACKVLANVLFRLTGVRKSTFCSD